jgi:hypothetical protein
MAYFKNLGEGTSIDAPPYPGWADKTIQIVEKAIWCAWARLISENCLDVASAKETAITAALQHYLVELLNLEIVDGFVSDVFPPPTRDSSVVDYSGEFLEKKPDLTFYCQHVKPVSNQRALFFECKPIGNINAYLGSNGLGRFIDGRYAWAMPHAGMIAYMRRRHPYDVQDALRTSLVLDGKVNISLSIDATCSENQVVVTEHGRDFLLRTGAAPGNIKIRHLWLDAGGEETTGE